MLILEKTLEKLDTETVPMVMHYINEYVKENHDVACVITTNVDRLATSHIDESILNTIDLKRDSN